MKLLTLFLTGVSAHRRLSWSIRAAMSVVVSLVLAFQPFFYLAPVQVKPPTGPLAALTQPVETARYAASLLSPGLALAQTDIITKTGPAITQPGETLSYPVVIYKTTPGAWLTNTVWITDTAPVNTTCSGATTSFPWASSCSGPTAIIRNYDGPITATGLITIGTFNFVVNSPLGNNTIISNTAYLSTTTGIAASLLVTTTVQASDFSLAKYASSSPVCAGSLLTYTVVVSNINPDINSIIKTPYTETDRLPSQVSLVYVSNSPVTSADTITWTMTTNSTEGLWGNGSNSITRTAVVSVPFSLTNGVTLTNQITVVHPTVLTASFTLPVTVTKLSPDFTFQSPLAYGMTAMFTNTTTGDAGFGWNFGDGGAGSAAISPTHFYTGSGVFNVTLTATSTHGCGVLQVTHPITVVQPATVTVTANPTTTYANGISSTLVTAVVSDTTGLAVPGIPLTFTTSLGNWIGDGQTMVLYTNSAGVATRALTSTVIGTAYITITAPNGLTGTAQVIFDLPRLALSKTGSPDPVNAGELLTYTLVYSNLSNVPANGVWLTDTLPLSVTLNGSAPPTTTQSGNWVSWNLSSLPPFSSSQIILTVTVATPIISGTLLTNTALITAPGVISTATGLVTTTVNSSHTLAVSKMALSFIQPWRWLTYTINYTVTGNEPALGAVITDRVPISTTFLSATWGITPVSNVLTWTLGNLSAPVTDAITFTVRTDSPLPNNTLITNTVRFSDTLGQATSHTITTTVVSSHTLHLVKSDTLYDPVDAGGLLTYTLAYSNIGDETALGAQITDTIPANTSFSACPGAISCTLGSGVVTWTLPTLNPNNAGVLTLTVLVASPLANGTTITNTARMYDTNTGLPAASTVTTTVRSTHTLVLLKSAALAVVPAGQPLTYTLAYTVTGNEMAQSVTITDTVPLSTTWVGCGGCSLTGSTLMTWNLGDLTPTISGLLTVTVAVTSPLANGTIITNTARLFDANAGAPVSSTVTTTVASSHTLTLLKTVTPTIVPAGQLLTYNLAYAVTGNEPAASAVITDAIPANTGSAACAGCTFGGGVATWTLLPTSLLPGASGVLTFTVAVTSPLPNNTVITNTGRLYDTNSGLPVSSTVTATVTSNTVITWSKSAIPPSGFQVTPGQVITYILTAANSGNQIATGVMLTDTVPNEANIITYTVTKAPPAGVVGRQLTWAIGTLTAGESVTATIQVGVIMPLTRGLVITNSGLLLTAQTGLSTTNFVTHTVISTPTLTLRKAANPASGTPVFPGNLITYTLIVSNTGSGPVTAFRLTDTVPISVNLVPGASVSPGFGLNIAGSDVILTGSLGAGQALTATFAVTVALSGLAQGDILSNTALVSFAESPVITQTNTVTHPVRLTPALTLTKLAQPPGPTIPAGAAITYTVIVTNNDAYMSTGIVLTDFIPAYTTYVTGSLSSSLGVPTGPDPMIVPAGSLTGSQAMSFTFQVTVNSPITDGLVITNTAQMNADYLGAVESNRVTHTIVATPQLSLVKSNIPTDTVTPGNLLYYHLALRNDGAGSATNVVITDTLPANVTVAGGPLAVPTNIISTITGSQWVSTVPVIPGGGGTADLYIFLRVTRPLTNGLVLTNTATYSSDQTPVSQSNAVTNTVSSQPVLLITKLANPLSGLVHPGDPITYSIRVGHDPTFSTENAPNVVITDNLPLNTNYVAGSVNLVGGVNPTANFAAGAALGHSDLLPLGEVMTLTYVVTVTRPLPNGTLISNVAWVDSDRTTPNISSFIFHTVDSQAVLTYTKNALPPAGPISPGQTITYTLVFTNTGDADATGLVITDVAPTYTTYVTNSARSTGLFGYNTGVITFSGMVPALNGVFTATFAARLPAVLTNGLTILNAARFTTVETGVVSQTNSVTHTVVSAPLLRLQKLASPPHGTAVSPGAVITYTLILTNSGTDNASGVVITDTFDPNVQAASNPQVWTVGALLAGRAISYTVLVTVTSPLTNGVIISNTARVTAAGVFTVSNAVTHTVVGQPNLIIYKTAIPPSGTYIDPGAVIAYYVNLRNTGNAPATNVIITDTLPISTSLLPPPPFPLVIPIGSVSGSNPLIATIPTIPADGSLVQFSFVVSVSSVAMPGLVVTNAAQITSNETTLTTTNVTTHPVKAPDLVLTKSANPPAGTPVQPGGFITYTLIVTNIGPAAANGVVLTDTISPAGAVGGVNPRVFTVTIPLYSNQSISYTLRVTVTNGLTAGLVISNVAQARSADTAVVTTPEVTHPVAAVPDLTIVKTATPPARSSLGANQPITYTISITNTGNTTATTLLLTDTLPFSVNLVTATLSSGGPVNGSNPLTASVTTLAASQRLTLTIVVTTSAVTTNTLITNTAQVIANAVPLRTSSPVTHIITATLAPNLVLSKTASPASGGLVNPGQIITYSLTLVNNGQASANGVVITDTFDPNVQAAPNPLVWNVGVITAGATMSYTMRVTVTNPLTNGTVITNVAQVAATGMPAAASNPVTHTVASAPNLLITKSANPVDGALVLPGQAITYTVVVTNNGTDTARNLTLTDFLPGGVNYVAGSVRATPGFGVILTPPPTLALSGTLPAGAMLTTTCQVTVTAAPGTVLTNTAQVTATNAVSRSAAVSHRVSLYSLVIGKTALPPAGVVGVGQIITYTVTVFNPGDPVTNVTISDTLDPNVSLLSVSSTLGTPGGSNPVQVTGFGLTTGQGVTVTVRVQVSNAASGTVISNRAGVTSAQTPLYISGVVTHVISVTGVVSPLFTIVKSATPPGGTTVTQNDIITYSITVVNNGGPATGVVVTDVIPTGVSYVPGSAATTLGNITFDGTRVIVTVPTTFTAGAALTTTFRVMVTTNQTTTITNTATLDSDQTLPQNSTVIHPVRGVVSAGGGVYLPIILKDYTPSDIILQWDNVEPVRDRVRDLDGAAGICVSFPCDGRIDGVFRLVVNIGSAGSKVVSNIRLVSTQGVEWNTIPGDGRPILGVFNGPPLNNLADGSIYGVLFNAGQVQLHLFASDDAGYTRFVTSQYMYTVIITFTDGSTMTAQTTNF